MRDQGSGLRAAQHTTRRVEALSPEWAASAAVSLATSRRARLVVRLGGGGRTHVQGVAAGAGGALADRLLAALVAGQAVRLVVDAAAIHFVAVHKQNPVGTRKV